MTKRTYLMSKIILSCIWLYMSLLAYTYIRTAVIYDDGHLFEADNYLNPQISALLDVNFGAWVLMLLPITFAMIITTSKSNTGNLKYVALLFVMPLIQLDLSALFDSDIPQRFFNFEDMAPSFTIVKMVILALLLIAFLLTFIKDKLDYYD